MSSVPPPAPSGDGYDVYISYPRPDVAWARRLNRDLSELGLRCFMDLDVDAGASWSEALNDALDSAAVLVVLWSAAAQESDGMRREIASFETLMRQKTPQRRMVPIVLGGGGLLKVAPAAVAGRQAVIIEHEEYAAGADTESDDWRAAIRTIAAAAAVDPEKPATKPAPSPHPTPEPASTLPGFSTTARAALTYAAEMLRDGDGDPGRLRSAALLGALRASASRGATPTTGDVLTLVLDRQPDGRGAEQTLAAAAAAVGLEPETAGARQTMTLKALAESPVRQLVLDAAEAQRRSGASSVHLRHVLATGVHRAVPAATLAELKITMRDLRKQWRPSLARTWPEENWDIILVAWDAAPPGASVHRDRWTVVDGLDYALYAKAISEFITHKDAKPPLVISVQAPWGQGKTSLMRMVQRNLDPGHPDLRDDKPEFDLVEPPSALTFGELRASLTGEMDVGPQAQNEIRTVWFNAWKYQSSEQVWAGLAHAILSQLPARLEPPKHRELFWLRLQLRRIDPTAVRNDIHRAALERFLPRLAGWAVLGLGTLIVAGISLMAGGLGAEGAGVAGAGVLSAGAIARRAWAKATKDVLERPLEGAYMRYVRQPDYASRLGYLHLVEEDMARALNLLTSDTKPTVIFIDDLDRCAPAKIGEVIEAVNMFLAGDYPNCAFVIGIDAEVVAAAMEVVHEQIIEKLGDRRGELGWRFMDKFVQLPFVIPRLQPKQRTAYLSGLFATARKEDAALVAEVKQLKSDVVRDELAPDEFARRAAQLTPRLAAVDPAAARELGEEVVSAGAKAFSDDDPEVSQALADQMSYLSDNPRTIKRAVNLYRFHRFAAFARQASSADVEVATPEQIGRWIVVIIRWPQFVRWLQAQREEGATPGEGPAARVFAMADATDSVKAFEQALDDAGITASWTHEVELLEFLRAEVPPDLRLALAGERGLW